MTNAVDIPPPVEARDESQSAAHRRRSLILIGLAVALVGFTMSLQMGLNSNFVAEKQGLNLAADQQGLLEGIRESCGIASIGVLALLAGVAEPLLGAAMLVLLGVGLGSYAAVHDYVWVVLMSLVWSQGLHVWMPLPNSMTLAVAEPGRAGHRLGQIGAAGALGSIVGLVFALGLIWLGVPLRALYVPAGLTSFAAAAVCLAIPRGIKTDRPRLVFRRRYGLYYLLCLLEGWRKQIFVAFAGFLLVKKYGAPPTAMLTIWLVTSAVCYVGSPWVGRLVDRIGERRVLLMYYLMMIAVFLGYAYVTDRYVLYVLYALDGIFFLMAMAQTTYVNRIAPKHEHTPTLAMGVAMNHVTAVLMPIIGGVLWAKYDFTWTFWAGALAAAASAALSLLIPPHAVLSKVTAPTAQPAMEQAQER